MSDVKIQYTPFKGRKLDVSSCVYVYRCLNRKGIIYSIKQKGYVVGHVDATTQNLTLENCDFIINKSGKERACKTHVRNVYAYIKGNITHNFLRQKYDGVLTYNPFDDQVVSFVDAEDNKPISNARTISLRKGKVYYRI